MSIKKEQLYFEEKILPAGESVITCSYDYYGTRMTASLRPTNAENYAYLGRIVIMSIPRSGYRQSATGYRQ